MEPEVAAFLKKVSKSILIAIIWLSITAAAAIKGDNAFVHDHITLSNALFYIWFLASIVVLVWLYKKMWRTNETI